MFECERTHDINPKRTLLPGSELGFADLVAKGLKVIRVLDLGLRV